MSKGIPSKEIEWTIIHTLSDETFIITSNKDRTFYYLYERCGENHRKIARSKNPNDFDKLIFKGDGKI